MKDKKTEFRSLNEELPALYAEELEQRLETDPLGVSGLLNEYVSDGNLCIDDNTNCPQYCPELQGCGCYGKNG